MARSRPGASVQLVINMSGANFLLSATALSAKARETHWSFWSQDAALWSYPTCDLELVENMAGTAIDQSMATSSNAESQITVIGAPMSQQPLHLAPAPAPPMVQAVPGPVETVEQSNAAPPMLGGGSASSLASKFASKGITGSHAAIPGRGTAAQAGASPSPAVSSAQATLANLSSAAGAPISPAVPSPPPQELPLPLEAKSPPAAAKTNADPNSSNTAGGNGATGVTLAGELSKVELSNVMQSVAICRMTGRLEVHNPLEAVELFFDDGNLVHAVLDSTLNEQPSRKGDYVVLELLTWDEGDFRFDPSTKNTEKTITRRIDALLMEGATLNDHRRYLASVGLDIDSRLAKNSSAVTEQQFEQAVAAGIPADQRLQKKMYIDIDGQLTLYDLTKRLKVTKPEWIPVLVNLLALGLIHIPHTAGSKNERQASLRIDEREIAKAWKSALSAESMILDQHLFLHFYFQEFARAAKSTTAQFSVAVFNLNYMNGGTVEIPANFAIREVMEHINELKAPIDLVGHFNTNNYAFLLPFGTSEYAIRLANQIHACLQSKSSDNLFDMRNMRINFGIANAPFDSSDPIALLELAVKANEKAVSEGNLFELASTVLQRDSELLSPGMVGHAP